MITYGKALAIYRQYHPDGPEPASEQTIPLSVNGLGTNWHLRTAGGQYIATMHIAATFFWIPLLRGGLLAFLAWAIFRRRQLAILSPNA